MRMQMQVASCLCISADAVPVPSVKRPLLAAVLLRQSTPTTIDQNAPKPKLNAVSNKQQTKTDHTTRPPPPRFCFTHGRGSFRVWINQNFVDVGDFGRISPKSSDLWLLRGSFRFNFHELEGSMSPWNDASVSEKIKQPKNESKEGVQRYDKYVPYPSGSHQVAALSC